MRIKRRENPPPPPPPHFSKLFPFALSKLYSPSVTIENEWSVAALKQRHSLRRFQNGSISPGYEGRNKSTPWLSSKFKSNPAESASGSMLNCNQIDIVWEKTDPVLSQVASSSSSGWCNRVIEDRMGFNRRQRRLLRIHRVGFTWIMVMNHLSGKWSHHIMEHK